MSDLVPLLGSTGFTSWVSVLAGHLDLEAEGRQLGIQGAHWRQVPGGVCQIDTKGAARVVWLRPWPATGVGGPGQSELDNANPGVDDQCLGSAWHQTKIWNNYKAGCEEFHGQNDPVLMNCVCRNFTLENKKSVHMTLFK